MGSLNMKRGLKTTATMLLLALAIVGCQQNKKGSVKVESRVGYPSTTGGVPMNPMQSGLELNGYVDASGISDEEFRVLVGDVMESVAVDPQYIGLVSGSASNNSGVYLGGRVQLQSGPLRSGVSSAVAQNSQLVIGVFDYWPEQGELPPLPQPYFVQAQGSVQGNYARILFTNDTMTIELEGQFNESVFEGALRYNVTRRADGSRGYSGTLGRFKLPTCRFFICG